MAYVPIATLVITVVVWCSGGGEPIHTHFESKSLDSLQECTIEEAAKGLAFMVAENPSIEVVAFGYGCGELTSTDPAKLQKVEPAAPSPAPTAFPQRGA